MKLLEMDYTANGYADAEAGEGTQYELVCLNQSPVPWVFYVYQKMPTQPSDIFSLAWFASPIRIDTGAGITFRWTIDYSFVWGVSGPVQPGVTYDAYQSKPCSPNGNNLTTFSVENNTPSLADPTTGGEEGSLTINQASNVPNLTYATGIGMSGTGTFVQQALANAPQTYTPEPEYYIAAANQMQVGVVLARTVTGSAKVTFPKNVFTMYATLNDQQQWNVSQHRP